MGLRVPIFVALSLFGGKREIDKLSSAAASVGPSVGHDNISHAARFRYLTVAVAVVRFLATSDVRSAKFPPFHARTPLHGWWTGGAPKYFAPSPLQYKTFTAAWGGDRRWIYLVGE